MHAMTVPHKARFRDFRVRPSWFRPVDSMVGWLVVPSQVAPRVTPPREHSRWGRVFLNNRYHDPTLATFISVDPLVTITGEAYIYASANPITYSDPTGLFSSCTLSDGELTCANDLENTEEYWEAANVHYDLGPENEDPLFAYGSQHWDPNVLAGARAGHNAARMNSQPLPGAGWLAIPLLGPLCVAWCSEAATGLVGRYLVRDGATSLWNRLTGRSADSRSVDPMEVLRDLQPGKNRPHRVVDDLDELNGVFDRLIQGGTQTRSGAPGSVRYELPNGGTVQLRPASRSGGATIDYVTPEGVVIKVHLHLP